MKDLVTQIDTIVIKTKERMLAVVRQSISDVAKEAQTPVAKGGRMRVKTGFLRSSGIASLNSAPSGPRIGDKTRTYSWTGETIASTLAKMKIGDVFYFGWTAHYAKYREAYDAFLETAIQNWQIHVDKAVAHFKNKDVGK